ncbi:hypothetical protein [Streptomyces halobius]|uniref:Uncharacterized protein n=1 Tax=Streptomyces halobius TaxID=2879846 RepID=A0ABY4MBP0_9ACTN|nr:hypothetical protein [Streptomyces halobius]UQA93716.1 hypothetical protein K9S39_19260 [Streptomyces halobius]
MGQPTPQPIGPLADLRGASGRTRAAVVAVRAALTAGADSRTIEDGSTQRKQQGSPHLW